MFRFLGWIVLAFCTLGLAQNNDVIVLKVGQNELLLGEFNERFSFYTNQLAQEQGIPMSPELAPLFNSLRPQYLDQLASEFALLTMGQNRGLAYNPEFVETRLSEIKANFPDEETYLQQIAMAGLSDATFRKLIAEADLSIRTIERLRSEVKVKPYQLQLYYDANKQYLATPAQACAKHILVPTLEEAKAIQAELDQGQSFEALAAEKSQDPGSGTRGGELGCFPMGAMVPEFEQAVFSAPLNQVTEPVKSQFGYHLILTYERQEATVPSLEDVRDQMQEGAENDVLRQLIDKYRANTAIEIYPELVKIEEATGEDPSTQESETTEDGGSE